jgi:ABC-type glycerol-3-phosphate transport system substrate-binding protein
MSVPISSSRRTLLAGGFGLAAGAVGLSGCGSRPAPGPAADRTPPGQQPAGATRSPSGDPGDTIRVSFLQAMSSDSERSTLAELTDKFMTANPGIVVDLLEQPDLPTLQRTIGAKIAAGEPPTVAQVQRSWAARYAEAEAIIPLDRYIAGAQQYEDFYDGIKAGLQLPDGKAWMWPFTASVTVLYYNTDLVQRPPATWDDFAKIARSVSRGRIVALSIDPGTQREPAAGTTLAEILAQAYGNPAFATDGMPQFTEPSVIRALQFLADLKKAGALAVGRGAPGRVRMADRTGAFDIAEVTSYGDDLNAVGTGFRMGTGQLPTGSGGRTANQLAGTNLALFAAADPHQKAAAWKYLQFLTAPEQQAVWCGRTGYLPVCQQATQQPEYRARAKKTPFLAGATAQLNSALPLPAVGWVDTCRGYLAVAIRQATAEGVDPVTALGSAQASARKAARHR